MRRLHVFYQIVAVICLAFILPISANAQGKVNRAEPKAQTITYERTDAFGDNDVVVRAVGSNGKWGAVDRNNKLVIPLKYGFLIPFYESDKSTVTYHYIWSANSRSAIIGFRLVL